MPPVCALMIERTKAGMVVAPGVDFGQAGKRADRFSYASSEEKTSKSWQDPALTSCHQSLQVRL